MKRVLLFLFLVAIIASLYAAWQVFGPVVKSPEGKYFFIRTGERMQSVQQRLQSEKIIPNTFFLRQVSKYGKFETPRPGKYLIESGMSLVDLVRKLKRGDQEPVRFVINKLRTKENFAGRIGRQFECDSTSAINFLYNNDSLKRFGVDSHTVMTLVMPNTYYMRWNGNMAGIVARMKDEHDRFWNTERLEKAKRLNLDPQEVYTMASIVEEETNKLTDKPLIASVYLNRIKRGMPLQADPTVKYAMRDFGLKRIYYRHLEYPSAYNTYRVKGLPPGPICTPSSQTIDAVLDAPETRYIFFVARPDFSGYSNFAERYDQHQKFARAYQKALDSLQKSKS